MTELTERQDTYYYPPTKSKVTYGEYADEIDIQISELKRRHKNDPRGLIRGILASGLPQQPQSIYPTYQENKLEEMGYEKHPVRDAVNFGLDFFEGVGSAPGRMIGYFSSAAIPMFYKAGSLGYALAGGNGGDFDKTLRQGVHEADEIEREIKRITGIEDASTLEQVVGGGIGSVMTSVSSGGSAIGLFGASAASDTYTRQRDAKKSVLESSVRGVLHGIGESALEYLQFKSLMGKLSGKSRVWQKLDTMVSDVVSNATQEGLQTLNEQLVNANIDDRSWKEKLSELMASMAGGAIASLAGAGAGHMMDKMDIKSVTDSMRKAGENEEKIQKTKEYLEILADTDELQKAIQSVMRDEVITMALTQDEHVQAITQDMVSELDHVIRVNELVDVGLPTIENPNGNIPDDMPPFYQLGEVKVDTKENPALGMVLYQQEANGEAIQTVNDVVNWLSNKLSANEMSKLERGINGVYNATYKRLKAFGQSDELADANAMLRSRMAYSLARIMGESVYKANLALGKMRQTTQNEFETGKKETRLSLLSFLIKNGGIKDEGGELKNLDAIKGRVGLVNNKKGLSLDEARELAEQHGYIGIQKGNPETDINTLLEAIESELRGNKIYNDVKEEDLQNYDEGEQEAYLDGKLEEFGVDTSGMTLQEKQDAFLSLTNAFQEEAPEQTNPFEYEDIPFQNALYQGQLSSKNGNVALSIDSTNETKGMTEEEFKQKMLETLWSFKNNKIHNDSLGADIEIRTSSIKKYKSFFADKNKRLIVPYIPELLEKANFTKEDSYTPQIEPNIKAYWKSDIPIKIDNDNFDVHLTVREDNQGNFFWDAQVKESSQHATPATNPGDTGAYNLNITPSKGNVKTFLQSAFAGSRVDYDKPSLEAIGSGEGHAAHGYGLYYALNKDVAERYREAFTNYNRGIVYLGDKAVPQEIASNISGSALYKAENGDLSDLKKNIKSIVNSFMEGNIWEKERISEGKKLLEYIDENEKVSISSLQNYIKENINNHYTWETVIKYARQEAKASGIKTTIEHVKRAIEKHIAPFIEQENKRRSATEEFLAATDDTYSNMVLKKEKGQVHEVDIPESPVLLDEEKTFDNQSEYVKEKLAEIFSELPAKYLKDYPKMGLDRVKEVQMRGSEIYGALIEAYGSDKNASAVLEKHGIKGITYDGRRDGRCFVIFNPKDVKVIQKFYQGMQNGLSAAHGAYKNGIVYLFETADASTFAHEMSHAYMDALTKLAQNGNEKAKHDLEIIQKWTGHQNLSLPDWERFARGFEEYLMEGKSPSQDMNGVFQRFKNWLLSIYNGIKNLRVQNENGKQEPVRINDDIKAFYDRMLGGQDIDEVMNTSQKAGQAMAVLEEKMNKMAELAQKLAEERSAIVHQMANEVKPHNNVLKNWMSSLSEGSQKLLSSILKSCEIRLSKIDPKLGVLVQRVEQKQGLLLKKWGEKASPFFEKFNKLKPEQQEQVNFFLLNGEWSAVSSIIGEEATSNIRELLYEMYNLMKESGVKLGFRENYFPRAVLDYDGLLEEMELETPALYKQMNEELGKDATPEQQAKWLDTHLMTYRGNISTSGTKNTKERKLDIITPRMAKFYKPSMDVMLDYMNGVAKLIAMRDFFGKNIGLLDESEENQEHGREDIGSLVAELLEGKKLSTGQIREVQDILNSLYLSNGGANAIILALRHYSYATKLSFSTTIRQFADIGMMIKVNGVMNTLKALFHPNEDITLEKLGIDPLGEEFKRSSKDPGARFADIATKWRGINWADAVMKNAYMRANYNSLVELAKQPDKFHEKYDAIFGDETDVLIDDLNSGEITEPVKVLLFHEISKIQPISRSAMPTAYLNYPNGRVMYMFKTFAMHRAEYIVSELAEDIRAKDYKKLGKDILADVAVIGWEGLVELLILFLKYGWKAFAAKEIIETFASSGLGVFGLNKHQAGQLARLNFQDFVREQIGFGSPFDDLVYMMTKKNRWELLGRAFLPDLVVEPLVMGAKERK